jgi:hypothetical protein
VTPTVLALLVVALGLTWWVVRRAAELRREAELREVRALEQLFAARKSADGVAGIDVESIFGTAPVADAAAGSDAALQAEVAAMLEISVAERPAAAAAAETLPQRLPSRPADSAASAANAPAATAPVDVAESPPALSPVRDLVQVFYEARGFLSEPADPSARPVEAVLVHRSDSQRAYAFAPLAEAPTEAALRSILERARGIGHKRLLIAVEGALTAGPDAETPAHGVRVLDRNAIESQLARLDAATAERIRARARQRAGQRLTAG